VTISYKDRFSRTNESSWYKIRVSVNKIYDKSIVLRQRLQSLWQIVIAQYNFKSILLKKITPDKRNDARKEFYDYTDTSVLVSYIWTNVPFMISIATFKDYFSMIELEKFTLDSNNQ